MRAATALAFAPTAGYDPRGGREGAAASSRPWTSVPTLRSVSSLKSSLNTPGTSSWRARRGARSHLAVSATSLPSTRAREGESGDERESTSAQSSTTSPLGGVADASPRVGSPTSPDEERRQRTASQRRKAEKKAIHSKKHPNGHDPEVSLHLQAKAMARSGDAKGALKVLRRGSRKFPRNVHIGVSYADALADDFDDFREGHGELRAVREGLAHLASLMRANPEDTGKSSVVHTLRGCLEERRLALEERNPDPRDEGRDAGPSFSASAALVRECFESAVAIDSSHAAAWHAWGCFEMRRGRTNKARRFLREARRLDPRGAGTTQTLAILERRDATRFPQARGLFAEALRLDATHAPTYTAWATMEAQAGNVTRAARVFREGEEATRDVAKSAKFFSRSAAGLAGDRTVRDPARSRSALLTAYGAFEAKRAPWSEKTRSRSRALFREARETRPENAHAFVAWAAAEISFQKCDDRRREGTEEPSEAREHPDRVARVYRSVPLRVIAEGLNAHPGSVQLLLLRANASRLAGDVEGAAAQLESLVYPLDAVGRENPKMWHALGVALRDAGRFEDAIDAFERGSDVHETPGMENLPCLTSAAAEAARRGDASRARRLFAKGSALASPGRGAGVDADALADARDGSSTFVSPLASVDGDGRAYEVVRGPERPRDSRGSRKPFRGENASPRDRSTHLRLWAAFEKRDGRNTIARALFARATVADPSDALAWLQWGQFERRVAGDDAARKRFEIGSARAGQNKNGVFLYQAWADLETSVGAFASAERVYAKGTEQHPASPELWLAFAAFQASSGRDPELAGAYFRRAAVCARGTSYAKTVRDVRAAHDDSDVEDKVA